MQTTVATLLGGLAFCGFSACRGATQPGGSPVIPGRYSVSWNRLAASCSPQSLPDPVDADSSKYVVVPTAAHPLTSTVVVQQSDSSVSVSPESGVADPVASLTLSGALTNRQFVSFRWSGARTEGPRAGGHTFYVEEARTDSGRFDLLVQSPPGSQIQSQLYLAGTVSLTFRENNANGPVFTSCQFAESITGGKVAGL